MAKIKRYLSDFLSLMFPRETDYTWNEIILFFALIFFMAGVLTYFTF